MTASQADPVPRSLPRGRHAAAREVVLASQRGRLVEAMASCVAGHGYADTTVAQVIARAGVSRKTFYEHFPDKQGCFLAAWDLGTDYLIAQIVEVAAPVEDWRDRLWAGTETYLQILSEEPDFARTFLIEVLGAGSQALERRASIHRRFSDVLRLTHDYALAQGADLPAVPDHVFRAATGAAWELVAEHVRTRGVEGLLDLCPAIVEIQLALLGGRYEAAAARQSP
jgi:AcrR family transcriptional regulator